LQEPCCLWTAELKWWGGVEGKFHIFIFWVLSNHLTSYISAKCLGEDLLKRMKVQNQTVFEDFRNKANQSSILSGSH